MAGVLDTARFRTFLAWELGVSVRDVTGFVLGGHGDQMVPVVSNTNVAGIPVTELIPAGPARRDRAAHPRRRRRGRASTSRRARRSTRRPPPSAEMVDSIVLDQKRVLPCAALLEGEYGLDGIFMGVPCKLGAAGIEQVIEVS